MPKNFENDRKPRNQIEFVALSQRWLEQKSSEQLMNESLIERTVPIQKGDTVQELIMGGSSSSILPITSITQETGLQEAEKMINMLRDYYDDEVAFHLTVRGLS